ncbi:PAQR family membrane homeostasis protein TrhA [Variovorax terrae]|uniref:Hemolysin III family protein n=1 Tax=Variovorax terrae TaxID=2923278 RepID=A0A9X1VV60_9BURK|nr:hemolysin III family protein [Variovorax terrae]MCJ0762599.1 hemolysin III family protein [Variovorax terrae]
MNAAPATLDRPQTLGEEIANSLSHGMGLLLALAGTPVLAWSAVRQGGPVFTAGTSVFALTMVLLYGASTVYHALPHGRAKQVFNVLDHSAIYLLIAGTYTPFTLGVLRGAWGWTLFGLVWGLALLGVALKATRRMSHPVLSTGLYLAMGWLVLIAIKPLYQSIPAAGLVWLVAGGLAYTAGVLFFVADSRWRYSHFVWHLFVMAGTACHFFAVLWYAA